VEERRWRGRARVVLVEARATDGSVFRRRELARNREGFGAREHQAVVTAGGTVATVVPEADTQRLVLRRGGREVREIERAFIKALGIEDGRTLRWLASGPTFGRRYLDLAPLPRNDAGCPARERFRRSELTEDVEVTEARYGELGETSVLRDRDPLDTGPPGAITGLRAEGSLLGWENAGQPRSAEIEPAA